MRKETLFDLGNALVTFIFMNILVTSVLFIMHCSISIFNFIIAFLFTVGMFVWTMKKKSYEIKKMLKLLGIFVGVIFGSILLRKPNLLSILCIYCL